MNNPFVDEDKEKLEKKEEKNGEDKKEKEKKKEEILDKMKLSPGYAIFFKILLIIQIIALVVMLVLFGLNHLVLFVASITTAIRIYLGIQYDKPSYYNKGLYFFLWCFGFHVLKIIYCTLLSFLTIKLRDNKDNLKDMQIIETKRILGINGFNIYLNGVWTLMIFGFCIGFWLLLLILFYEKQYCFDYVDTKEDKKYLALINEFYGEMKNKKKKKVNVKS